MLKVSIITVVFNNASTIRDAINSVLNQTYDDIEYILVDGKSTDGTVEIIKSYGNKIHKFISEEDAGIYDAMNKGISLASGDIIGILNSDDIYTSDNVISRVVYEFESKKVDSIFSDLVYVHPTNLNKIIRKWRPNEFVPGSFSNGWHPPHPTFFVKRNIYDRYGTFDISFDISADFELMLRLLEKYKISNSYIPEVLVKMRIGGESNKTLKNILIGNKNIRKAFKKNGIKINFFYTPIRLFSKVFQYIEAVIPPKTHPSQK